MEFLENIFKKYNGGKLSLSGLTDELLALYLNKILKTNKQDIIIVTSSLFEANQLYQILVRLTELVFLFPMDDFLTSEAIAMSPNLKIMRLETLSILVKNKRPKIIITHLTSFLRYLPQKKIFEQKIIKLEVGSVIKKADLVLMLVELSYQRETLVSETGDFGERGFIVDVFPLNEENPVRFEFWGDKIDAIRYFNLDTQLSYKTIKEILIFPFTEFLIESEQTNIIKKQKYLPIYNKNVVQITDYFKKPIVVYKDYFKIINTNKKLQLEIKKYKKQVEEMFQTNYIYNFDDFNANNEIYVNENNIKGIKTDTYNSKPLIFFNQMLTLEQQCKRILSLGKTIIIYVSTADQIKKLEGVLFNNFIITNDSQIFKQKINIVQKDIAVGFVINDYYVFSYETYFFGEKKMAVYQSRYKYCNKIKDFTKLKIGDYVVHNIHGIGIYKGLTTLNKGGIKKDYLEIEYKDCDKLYIPVEKIDLIFKYSSQSVIRPRLHKLGGTEWAKTKTRIKGKLINIAKELLLTSALRGMTKGFAFARDDEHQIMFESEFKYKPTVDQIKVIDEIKQKMEKAEPMDHLLCGDVGYGKTEVAFRAAFKAINSNKQVVYLCPTTILSHQHYLNACERFKNFPVKIALLNRFILPSQVKRIIEELKSGNIDFVIGTHRLLSKDISYFDLGLLIIDEEQRFGVVHKEKIKKYKAEIDVLSLSATPIPRTLQLAMAGVKGLSVIETPPANRFPIQTYIIEYNEKIIKDAIYNEMGRNGQIFFLSNRISNIGNQVSKLKRLVPEAKITCIHGQMGKHKIELEMVKFINGEYDLLVCTTIVETGIDIPNVNTLIIDNADFFGLSQLYQIRGRVGRSNKIAYAYLMYEKRKVLSEIAEKRLSVIQNQTKLGSGFEIARHDLAIRGAGNILGAEQAGYIDAIGIDLYLKMLNEEIVNLKGKKGLQQKEQNLIEKPVINIATSISDDYVQDSELKLEIHHKINKIDDYESLIETKKEIEDRFGKVNEEMLLYMHQEWLEKLAVRMGIAEIKQTANEIIVIWDCKTTNNLELAKMEIINKRVLSIFKFEFTGGNFKAILPLNNLEKHWLYVLIEFLCEMSNI